MKKEVQEFLEGLDETDIEKIKESLKVYDTVKTLGWAIRWVVLSALSIIVLLTQFKEYISKLFH